LRFLDIDLDFFLDGVANCIPDGCTDRLSDNNYNPWPNAKVTEFLEGKLGLQADKRIKGKVFRHHNEVLYYWRNLINESKLTIPFEIIHVDSHADLGLGYSSWVFIFEDLLGIEVADRPSIEKYKDWFKVYNEPRVGDFLLFAIAYRWVSKLDYICHPTKNSDDYVWYILKDCVEPNDRIQLPHNRPATALKEESKRKEFLRTAKLEPEVEFNIVNDLRKVDYNGDFDYMTLTISPNYTPVSSDSIIEIVRKYIDFGHG
jgi:hypothetical protein